jgi:hypothetical protein
VTSGLSPKRTSHDGSRWPAGVSTDPLRIDPALSPAARPLAGCSVGALQTLFEQALAQARGLEGAHCIHELWMRGQIGLGVEACLDRLWKHAAASVPDWLPMRHFEQLALLYELAARFRPGTRGASNGYLVLLDRRDSHPDPYGFYVGMSHYSPAQRFDQHKAGIRAAGSVLRRGLEVLNGPTQHLRRIGRVEALQIEGALADELRASGLFVQGGH